MDSLEKGEHGPDLRTPRQRVADAIDDFAKGKVNVEVVAALKSELEEAKADPSYRRTNPNTTAPAQGITETIGVLDAIINSKT